MKELENIGIKIVNSAGDMTFKGTVALLLGDNLGIHVIGGFSECFRSYNSCRFCSVSKDTLQTIFKESSFELLDKEIYTAQLANIEANPELISSYAVKKDSALNKLTYFHISVGAPSDIAHDIFEGFTIDLIKNLLEHALKK